MFKFVSKRPWLAALASLAIVLMFHSPRLWLLLHENPGTFEWDRALVYLKQCQAPFRLDIEPAMRWRWFPQIFVYLLGGGRPIGLLFPGLVLGHFSATFTRLCTAKPLTTSEVFSLRFFWAAPLPFWYQRNGWE